jgi:hypothetical protein
VGGGNGRYRHETQSWHETAFVAAILDRVKIDGVALHLYPIGPKQLDTLTEACRMAHKAGKPVLLDEAWLYKSGPGEREGIATSERVFERDLWSFWTPLDRRFSESVGAFVQTEGVIYVLPFWSHLYFASLPYDAALDAGGYPYLGTFMCCRTHSRKIPQWVGRMLALVT